MEREGYLCKKTLPRDFFLWSYFMTRRFIPPEGYHHAQVLRDRFANWLVSFDVDWFITLNFNRPISIEGARHQFKEWLGRVDRSLLGPKWHRKPSSERTFAVATIENPDRNTHLHLLLKFPSKAAELSRSEILTKTKMCDHWKKLEVGGQLFSEPINEMVGLAGYVTKQFTRRGHLESCLIFSNEFHP
jgi:hypothetical protein